MKLELPEKAEYIIQTIQEAGFEAYAVGGCVRDSLLGRKPMDWDITTSATPMQVKALFRRTIDTGIQHGTVTVMLEKEGFEVTTYRVDGKYEDSRHPREVVFTPNLEEDLKRRDFTINAMAYNPREGLIDIFGGEQDLAAGIIRCVGNARERFSEDALRIMRAVRFSAQLGFAIEKNTARAAGELAENLRKISAERIQTELVKLVVSDHPDYLRKAYELGITGVVLPEFDRMMETPQNHPHHMYNVGEHSLQGMLYVEKDKNLRLAMLFHDIGKPDTRTTDERGTDHFRGHPQAGEQMTKSILKRLRFDNDTISFVSRLVRFHDFGIGEEASMKMVRRAMNRMGEDLFPSIFRVKYADVYAQSEYKREEKLEQVRRLEVYYEQILEQKQCVSLKTLALTGRDLIELGVCPGVEIGSLLNELLQIVLEDPDKNTRVTLTNIVKERLGSPLM
ncbi:MAG: CCA tRNA nucleotidyltransferase [Acetatifactor sp.]